MGMRGRGARPRSRRWLAVALLCALLLGAGPVGAEHEADHRYTILGSVHDAAGVALTGRGVSVLDDGAVIGAGKTDSEGNYSIRLHLHNPDFGKELEVRAGTAKAHIRVSFDSQDEHTERVHHVNFKGEVFDEEARAHSAAPGWVLVLIGVVVFMALATLSSIIRRRVDRYARKRVATGASQARPARAKRKKKRR